MFEELNNLRLSKVEHWIIIWVALIFSFAVGIVVGLIWNHIFWIPAACFVTAYSFFYGGRFTIYKVRSFCSKSNDNKN